MQDKNANLTSTNTTQSLQSVESVFPACALPAAMASALEASRVAFVTNSHSIEIPIRAFGENRPGLPVLMMHGLQSHSGWFVQSGRFIANQGYPLYAIDRRGSGLSRQPRGHADSYQEMIDDIDCVASWAMQKHGTEQVHILGHCFGAIPATAYACQHPDRVRTLVLPTPGIYTQSDLSLRQKLRIVSATLSGRRLPIPVPLSTQLFTSDSDYQRFIRSDELSLVFATASLYREVPRLRGFVRKHALRLNMPVFMAIAGQDAICDNVQNRRFFATIPAERKQLIEYTRAVHILEFSPDRDNFFGDLTEWLSTA